MPQGELPNPLTEASFVDFYGDSPAMFGPTVVPLKEALALEEVACTAPEERRTDETKRMAYLAGSLLAAGSLRIEHLDLVPVPNSK